MKKWKVFVVFITIYLLLALTLGVTGCAPTQSNIINETVQQPEPETETETEIERKDLDNAEEISAYPKTVVDSTGRAITIDNPLERIVVIFPQVYEAMRTMGLSSDLVVGVARDTQPYDLSFFPELASVPSVGGRWEPNVETILSLQPDAVIIHPSSGNRGGTQLDEATEALEKAGVVVMRFGCNALETYAEEVTKLGYIFDRIKEAEEHLAWRENILALVAERLASLSDEEKPNVYFMPTFDNGTYYIYGELNYVDMTGGNDVFAEQPKNYMTIDTEEIIKRNPDIIVRVAPMGSGGLKATGPEELKEAHIEIMERPELKGVTAIKNGEVFIITDQLLSFFMFSGNRHFMQLVYQAKWFHPELFADVEPKTIFQEYLTKYQGLNVDLTKQGAFVYHPDLHPHGY